MLVRRTGRVCPRRLCRYTRPRGSPPLARHQVPRIDVTYRLGAFAGIRSTLCERREPPRRFLHAGGRHSQSSQGEPKTILCEDTGLLSLASSPGRVHDSYGFCEPMKCANFDVSLFHWSCGLRGRWPSLRSSFVVSTERRTPSARRPRHEVTVLGGSGVRFLRRRNSHRRRRPVW